MSESDPNQTTTFKAKVGGMWVQVTTKSITVLIGLVITAILVYIGLMLKIHIEDTRTQTAVLNSALRDVNRELRNVACLLALPEAERKQACMRLSDMP